jgi:hypothetical protein
MVEVTKSGDTLATQTKTLGGAATRHTLHAKAPPIAGKKTKEQLRGLPPSHKTLSREHSADANAATAVAAKNVADAAATKK